MSDLINVVIDNQKIQIPPNTSILKAAQKANIYIPTLCHHDDLCVAGNCRVCVVEVEGRGPLEASCATPVADGMVIKTNSPKIRQARKDVVGLLVSEHYTQCTTCYRNTNCELQTLAAEYNVDNDNFPILKSNPKMDKSSVSIEKDDSKCIRCQRCVRTCAELQHVNAISVIQKGDGMKIATFGELPMNDVVCVNCAQCVIHCPTGALTEKRYFNDVWNALGDPDKHVIVNTAPSVRAGLGEMFGMAPGTAVTGKMVAALRRMGFDSVLDTDFAADLTIMEEGTELLQRLTKVFKEKDKDAKLPMLTSCSPGWVKFIEHMYPDLLDHLSTAKSPQQMFGAVAKTYYAQKKGIDPEKLYVVAGMPCAAKKFEANRPEMRDSGFQDVDAGLTTREIGHMIKQAGIDFMSLPDEDFDSMMGESTGASVIFGTTGGVMEAALRTAYELITGRAVPFDNLDIMPVRGLDGIKEATLKIEGCLPDFDFLEGVEFKIGIAHGLINARTLMDQVKAGTSPYHFIEVMACPGGCIGGGGAPIPTNNKIRELRAKVLYAEDKGKPKRKSHENDEIKEIYNEFLKAPCSEISHKLLHTKYRQRNRY